MRSGRWLSLAVIMWLAGASQSACADPSLTDRVVAQLRAALPGYTVTAIDPLSLKIGKAGQPESEWGQVNLDRIANYCAAAPDACADEIADFVHKLAPVIQARQFSPSMAALRAVVRPERYLAQLSGPAHAQGGELVAERFAGDVMMLCYFDMPTAMRPVSTTDLAKLGLTREKALATCQRNSRAALPQLPATPPPAPPGEDAHGYLKGDPYASSYLLQHDDWSPMARALGGRLLVAAPDADLILYRQDTGPAAVNTLSAEARQAYGEAERPISETVFRWTNVGWEVAKP